MTIGPNSVIVVPSSRGGQTTVFQRAGDILFEIDRRNVRHFAVKTPNLAAVVKGTQFQVSVRPSQSVVIVNRGSVEVSGLAIGEAVDLAAGQRAGVRGRGRLTFSDPSLAAKVRRVPSRAPQVAPATARDITTASNAGGNGNGNAYGLSGGNGNGNAYGLSGGNGNGNGNAYGLSGGNGNSGNSNAGGNVNGNSGNSNAGGNGNGNGGKK